MVVTSFCLFLLCVGISRSVSDLQSLFLLVSKIGSWHCANRAAMFCWFGAKKVKTKVQCQKQGLA